MTLDMLSGIQHGEDPTKEAPCRLAASDHRLSRLGEAQPHEAVPRVHRGEDQRVDHPTPAGHRIGDQAHLGEVDLELLTGLTIRNSHRGPPRRAPYTQHLESVALTRLAGPGEWTPGQSRGPRREAASPPGSR